MRSREGAVHYGAEDDAKAGATSDGPATGMAKRTAGPALDIARKGQGRKGKGAEAAVVIDWTTGGGGAARASAEVQGGGGGRAAMTVRASQDVGEGGLEGAGMQAAGAVGAQAGVAGAEPGKGDGECVICLDREKTHLVVPCGHWALCGDCAALVGKSLSSCPVRPAS